MEETVKQSNLPQSPDLPNADLITLQNLIGDADPYSVLYQEEALNPVQLGFIPESNWAPQAMSMQRLHEDYFGRKNNLNRRFEHKLWNALRITTEFPAMVKLVGVVWVTNTVIKVYKFTFAKLLNIAAIDGGLFHKQGNFTRHGFVPLTEAEARKIVPEESLADVDFHDVLLITHAQGNFTMESNEEAISRCKWDNPAGVSRVASLKIDLTKPM